MTPLPDDGRTALAWEALSTVLDPELPAVNIVELGLVREVTATSAPDGVLVAITPTFSACPAWHVIERNAVAALEAAGVGRVVVEKRIAPAWSSDDMTEGARAKLERFGIAPPAVHGGLVQLAIEAPVRCPRCGHPDTRLRNAFGSTLCREIRTCAACHETFERFKPL
ncbi:MAG TPA: 1,2-phenylacetyl-CoA epoxidase subunit PaaD [Trueperaceae bacterium]|nr:1,2-phenylacetyl-CoA epoxidase subunit PaaD [Trueperaceae bacterium]